LAQLSHELDLQAARLKDLELQNRQLLDPWSKHGGCRWKD
jgi:hypothetical protein